MIIKKIIFFKITKFNISFKIYKKEFKPLYILIKIIKKKNTYNILKNNLEERRKINILIKLN